MSTRRAILKLIGGAPVAGKSALTEIGAALAGSENLVAAATLSGVMAGSAGQASSPVNAFAKSLQRLRKRADGESWIRQSARQGHIDPDIACLRSMSAVRKARLQIDRDIEDKELVYRVEQLLWND